MRVILELGIATEDRPPAVSIPKEQPDPAGCDMPNLPLRHSAR